MSKYQNFYNNFHMTKLALLLRQISIILHFSMYISCVILDLTSAHTFYLMSS